MKRLRTLWKVFLMGLVIVTAVAVGQAARLFLRGTRLRAFRNRLTQFLARRSMAALDLHVTVEGAANWRPGQNYLVVSNHLSYLDAIVIAAQWPVCFVTSVEIQRTPGLGAVCASSGCLFVERRHRAGISEEMNVVAETLRAGIPVLFFPEGTSTDGSRVLPFKGPFFGAALAAAVPVLPLVLQFQTIEGAPVTTANRDLLCWYGDMQFGPHLFKLAGYRHIHATVRVLPEIPVTPTIERRALVEEAQVRIRESFRPIPLARQI